MGPEEEVGPEVAVGAAVPAGPEVAVDVGVEVGQPEVAAARRVAAAPPEVVAARRVAAAPHQAEEALAHPAIAVARQVLTRIIPAALLSVTTRWLPYRILFARRTASGP